MGYYPSNCVVSPLSRLQPNLLRIITKFHGHPSRILTKHPSTSRERPSFVAPNQKRPYRWVTHGYSRIFSGHVGEIIDVPTSIVDETLKQHPNLNKKHGSFS